LGDGESGGVSGSEPLAAAGVSLLADVRPGGRQGGSKREGLMKNGKQATAVLVGCVGCMLLLRADGVRAQDWPQWRGPNRDNKVTGFTAPKEWPKTLTQKWTVKVGTGHASPVLAGHPR